MIKEVEIIKTIEVPVEIIKEIEVIKEIPVIKTIEVAKPYEVIKHVPIYKEIEKPVIQKVPVAHISHYTNEIQLPKLSIPSLPHISAAKGPLSGLLSGGLSSFSSSPSAQYDTQSYESY